MIFICIVVGVLTVLSLSVMFAVFKQKEIKINVISRESVEDKEFFALRIESDDFLFIKKEEAVTFVQHLDDVNEYKIVDLLKEVPSEDKLVMPVEEKKLRNNC